MHHNIDFIIVGGGLAGSILALELIDRDADILLIDAPLAGAASPIAAGIANPVTGKRLVLEPEFLDKLTALNTFALKLEKFSGCKYLTKLPQTRYLDVLQQQQLANLNALPEFQKFKLVNKSPHAQHENSLYIGNTFRLDIAASCQIIHTILDSKKSRIKAQFDYDELNIGNGNVRWREFQSKKIIFCEGWRGIHNPWFNNLPFNLNKGQLLKLGQPNSQPSLKNWGQWELHTGTERWLGATTERNHQVLDPDTAGRNMLLESLAVARERHTQNLPLVQEDQIIQQYAGVRPATIDRKPFVGMHPAYPPLGIFNGFGGKGSLHIPHTALAFVDQLLFTRHSHNQARLDQLLLSE